MQIPFFWLVQVGGGQTEAYGACNFQTQVRMWHVKGDQSPSLQRSISVEQCSIVAYNIISFFVLMNNYPVFA